MTFYFGNFSYFLVEIVILNILEKNCNSFSFHPNFGFLTANPKYIGSGASLTYFIKED